MRATYLAIALVALLPSIAQAESGRGYVTDFTTVPGSHSILFNQDGARANLPQCGSNNPTRWAIDPTTAHGQAVAAALLTAFSLHKQVYIVGTGDCSLNGDTESVLFLQVFS